MAYQKPQQKNQDGKSTKGGFAPVEASFRGKVAAIIATWPMH
jgi:hypothetical protein